MRVGMSRFVLVFPELGVQMWMQKALFRGSRTLIQLLEQGQRNRLPPLPHHHRSPTFQWRGMHLDVCRHFFPVEFVKKYIDLLARYKMNSFHWHLTEDQGWRIEIKKYPKLTEVGAWRSGSQVGPYSRREYDSIPTAASTRRSRSARWWPTRRRAHQRGAGDRDAGACHGSAGGYPQLGCTGGPYEVQKGWGVFEDVFCAGTTACSPAGGRAHRSDGTLPQPVHPHRWR
jgi:hexosaminidase